MSRSNYDKPFYVDVGTSIVAVRCASNHDVVLDYDYSRNPAIIELAETACDRMNKEAEIGRPRRNCDVGTPEEQGERCMAQFDQWRRKGDGKKLITAIMAWAQMPYEQEGAGK